MRTPCNISTCIREVLSAILSGWCHNKLLSLLLSSLTIMNTIVSYDSLNLRLLQKFLTFLVFVLLLISNVQAQSSVNAGGGLASSTTGTTTYSIGITAYTSILDGAVSQGVQHAYEIFSVSLKETSFMAHILAYPNPTSDNLMLQINDYENKNLSYKLFNTHGKILDSGKIVAQQTQIPMMTLSVATYHVVILTNENKIIQSFRIVKMK